MIPNSSYNVANVQVSALPIGVTQIEGYFKGGTNAWLQVFDSCVAPVVGAIPTYQLLLNSTAQFQETLQISQTHFYEGVFVGVSSTEGTYTASASTMDIVVWTDVAVISTNIVGDKTTTVSNLIVWNEATGAASNKLLYSLIVNELNGVVTYLYLTSTDSLYNNPPGFFATLQPNSTNKFYFGQGFGPISNVLPSTLKQGCHVLCSIHPGIPLGTAPALDNGVSILAITN